MYAADFYWENPLSITNTDSRFPLVLQLENGALVLWEEIDSASKTLYLSSRYYRTASSYSENARFAGPFSFSGEAVPDLYSAAVSDDGTIAVAVASSEDFLYVYTSTDMGGHFSENKVYTSVPMLAPKIFCASGNVFRIFTSVGNDESFSIYTSASKNGADWEKFREFQPSSSLRNCFSPFLVRSADGDVVVFQAQFSSSQSTRFTYQLYAVKQSANGSWSEPVLITDENSLPSRSRAAFYSYQNQRPFLYNFAGDVFLAWERGTSSAAEIWCAQLDLGSGTSSSSGSLKISSGTAQSVGNKGASSRAVLFSYQDSLFVEWFDSRRGKDSVYYAKLTGGIWEEKTLIEDKNENQFSYPMKFADGSLSFVWQQHLSDTKNSIALLLPDTTVLPPSFTPLSFRKGRASASKNVQVRIDFPDDSSKIAGYSYTWNKDDKVPPEKNIMHFTNSSVINLKADSDGYYYLTARVMDYAGNWSESASIAYHLDLTPPSPPRTNFSNLDRYGFISSNTFSLRWRPSASEDTVSYAYRLDYLGEIPKSIAVSKNHPMALSAPQVASIKKSLESKYASAAARRRQYSQAQKTSSLSTKTYSNLENGVYALTLWAVDAVGNVSAQAVSTVILNKFQPSTFISSVGQEKRSTGELVLTLNGGGFTYDGTISAIYIDTSGSGRGAGEAYAYTIPAENFKVVSDSKITGVVIPPELEQGTYKIGLNHTDRGIYFTKDILQIAQNGTAKIEAPYIPSPRVSANFKHYVHSVNLNTVLTITIILCVIIILIVIFFIILHAGVLMASKNQPEKTKRQPSIKGKLIRYTCALVILIVAVVTVQNVRNIVTVQASTMAQALQNRTDVLLESLCSGVRNFLPANNILELTALPAQKEAMPEVKYITIIGQKTDSSSSEPGELDFVWATNDADITSKIDTYSLIYGESKVQDEAIRNITASLAKVDLEIAQKESEISAQIENLSGMASALYASPLESDQEEAERLSSVIVDLRNRLDAELLDFAKTAGDSIPYFDANNFSLDNTDYIFYRPVIYRKGTSGNYVHGVVILELSTQTVIDSLREQLAHILIFSAIVAAIAVLIGIFGSYVFASLIVRPIKKLEAHVRLVGQTKDKILLKGKSVNIKSKDEIGRLGAAVNNMTRDIVSVAEEEALVMDGKAVQNAFLPLSSEGSSAKNSFARYKDDQIECFGYYEGESGVSGDYFDYKRLDNQWFVIIKCDASGHGIPAAIIMTVVATIFRNYFESWDFKKNGIRFNDLVSQINDFIEKLGLKGKFATLIVCLLNLETGELYMCNAGDNIVHIFDSQTGSLKQVALSSAPTAGVFSSDLVELKGGFKVEKTVLNHGDVLYLYTDGIEEATRRLRKKDYSVIKDELQVRRVNPETHKEEIEIRKEDAKEEFGTERIKNIVEAVHSGRLYELEKNLNPDEDERLTFDFSKSSGSIEDSVFALASIEKVFRMYKSPQAQDSDYIKIDKKIDECLFKYFNKYDVYASHKTEPTDGGHYIYYDKVQEDEQSDDLTLLAVKRI